MACRSNRPELQNVFLQRDGGYVGVTVDTLAYTFSPNQFCGHDKLLWRQVGLIDSTNCEFRQMDTEFLGKFAHSGQAGVQHFSDGVVEACDADVIRNANT